MLDTISHQLGADGLKDCFREPIPEVFEAADLLAFAVTSHLRGYVKAAEEAIARRETAVLGQAEALGGDLSAAVTSLESTLSAFRAEMERIRV